MLLDGFEHLGPPFSDTCPLHIFSNAHNKHTEPCGLYQINVVASLLLNEQVSSFTRVLIDERNN